MRAYISYEQVPQYSGTPECRMCEERISEQIELSTGYTQVTFCLDCWTKIKFMTDALITQGDFMKLTLSKD